VPGTTTGFHRDSKQEVTGTRDRLDVETTGAGSRFGAGIPNEKRDLADGKDVFIKIKKETTTGTVALSGD
jgi:hypothetical protein